MPSAPLPRTNDPFNKLTSSGEIRPSSRGIVFSPRPILNAGKNSRPLRGSSSPSKLFHVPVAPVSSAATVMLRANPNLTSIEVESIIREKVTNNSDAIRRAFHIYDAERCTNVTKGEFRRVLDNYCLPLTTAQFNNLISKIDVNADGTIPYKHFLEMFTKISPPLPASPESRSRLVPGRRRSSAEKALSQSLDPNQPKYVVVNTSKDQSMDTIERQLQHRIASNLKNVIRGLQLFDYNRDGQIQRHELKRVLDNYTLKMTDAQFDRLWSRYDFHHVGTIDYRDFLRRLGVNAATAERQLEGKESLEMGTIAGPIGPWDVKKKKRQREKEITDMVLQRNQEKSKYRSQMMDDKTLVQLEKEFRSKMRSNQGNIERAMRAFDDTSDGFITIDDLKAVIDNFVMPTTDEVFQQLMHRFAVRGTGKISWEQFIGKFQDPQGVGNGQTIPIGQNHKVNPIRASIGKSTMPEVFAKLKNHVLENFSSLKKAFLVLDENRKGVLTRKDLRRVLESFTLRLSDDNVKELFSLLDPEHTGFINYQKFLDVFEQKESVKAHKWLYSKHKVNQNQHPAILAWDTVEDILREKLSENYRQVADEFAIMDSLNTGFITQRQLRRILDRYALPLSDEHFDKLWSACPEGDKNQIEFSCFLDNLGIEVKPGDVEGPSTRIHDESNAAEMQRQVEHQGRMNDITKVNLKHTMRLSAEEVITKLKRRMAQHDTGIRQTFLKYSKSGKGRVTRKDLKHILEDMGFVMDDVQFKEFLSMLHCDKRGLSYSDFIACFQDLRVNGMGEELERAGNHIVNKTNLVYMTAMECYEQIIERMRQNYSSVRNAFFKVDDDHDGILTMHEFRRMLDSFMFIITDETFYELLKMLGLHKKSLLSYFEFMEKFEVVDRPEGHPWLNSQHRFNSVRKPIEMTADMVHECLCLKAEQAWADMVRTFRNFDADGNGVITRRDLRALLFRYTLPLSHDQFKQLWKRYDDQDKGYVTQADFLIKLGRSLAPGDDLGLQGTSRKIIEENVENIRNHLNFQEAKHKEIAQNQALLSKHYSAERVERELKDRFREHFSDFDKAFKRLDRNRDGYVTLTDLQRILLQLNYFLDEEQFISLLQRLGLSVINDRLSYFDFLRAIDDGRASKFENKDGGNRRKDQVMWQTFDNLPVEKALAKLKEKITVNYDSLNAGFRAFDRGQTGTISVSDFRRLLDNFCFKMTDKQFRAVLSRCKISTAKNNTTKMVNWIIFLHEFTQIMDTKMKEWTDHVGKAAPPQSAQEVSLEKVEERIREVVTGRYNTIANAFIETDYANIFVVSKDDFREILNEHVMRLSDDQFNRLWSKLPVNEFHNLDYKEFLKKYRAEWKADEKVDSDRIPDNANDLNPPVISGGLPRESLIYNRRPESRAASVASAGSSRGGSMGDLARRSATLVNAESAEGKLKPLVYRNWQKIQKECRKLDSHRTGCILPDQFIGIIDSFGLMLSIDEARALMTKYDIGNKSGMFAYQDFLRNFILKMKPSEESVLRRKQIRIGEMPIAIGKENPGFLAIMMSLKQKIPLFWKEMRRTFKIVDTRGDGYVTSAVFRQVLRRFTINLTEEDFYNLLSFYDPKMQGKIPYNEFIRAFL